MPLWFKLTSYASSSRHGIRLSAWNCAAYPYCNAGYGPETEEAERTDIFVSGNRRWPVACRQSAFHSADGNFPRTLDLPGTICENRRASWSYGIPGVARPYARGVLAGEQNRASAKENTESVAGVDVRATSLVSLSAFHCTEHANRVPDPCALTLHPSLCLLVRHRACDLRHHRHEIGADPGR